MRHMAALAGSTRSSILTHVYACIGPRNMVGVNRLDETHSLHCIREMCLHTGAGIMAAKQSLASTNAAWRTSMDTSAMDGGSMALGRSARSNNGPCIAWRKQKDV